MIALTIQDIRRRGSKLLLWGGNSLSRGLTLEGLGVSYFYRKSLMYDTLLQMGRWFGYRPKYEDLFKIWMSEETIDWYGYITQATNELKDEVQRMQDVNQTPKEFGLKVRQDPNSLLVTARNKMKTATKLTRPVTVSGRLLESPRLYADLNTLKNNEFEFKAFINSLASAGQLDETQKNYYWRGVPKHLIASLLRKFKTHPWHLAFQGCALADYIINKMDGEPWDVALTTTGEGAPYLEGLQYGDKILHIPATQRRTIIADEKIIRISGTKVRVGSGGCTRVGLSKEQIQAAKDRFKKLYPKRSMPDSAYLIQERKPLLMLYIVNKDLNHSDSVNTNIPEFLFALGVGFPQSASKTQTATYMVNLVEFKSLAEFEEEVD